MFQNLISIKPDSYLYFKLYQHHGNDFQNLFNKIMQQIDEQFHPIKQKRDYGNDGYSPSQKTQFACYSPEKNKPDTDILKKAKGDWETFQNSITEDSNRLTNLKEFIFVFNLDELPESVSTFIRNCTLENITVKFWLRNHLIDQCRSLTMEQFKTIFPDIEDVTENNKLDTLRQQLELSSVRDTVLMHENTSIPQALLSIDDLLKLPTLSYETKKFCKVKKLEYLLNLNQIAETEEYFEQVKSDITPEQCIITQAWIFVCKHKDEDLRNHILNYIKTPPSIPHFLFFVSLVFSEDELTNYYDDIDKIKNDIYYQKGYYQKLKKDSYTKSYEYINIIIQENETLDLELVELYVDALFCKYINLIPDFCLTTDEENFLNQCLEDMKTDLFLYTYALFLLKQYDKIAMSIKDYEASPINDNLITILYITAIKTNNTDSINEILKYCIDKKNIILLSVCLFLNESIDNSRSLQIINFIKACDTIDETTLFRLVPFLTKHKEWELLYEMVRNCNILDIDKNFDKYRLLLRSAILLNKPKEELQKYITLVYQYLPQEVPIEILREILFLFTKYQNIEYVSLLYQNYLGNRLDEFDQNTRQLILECLIQVLLLECINSYIDEYIQHDFDDLELHTVHLILIYIKIYAYEKASPLRTYLMKFINTKDDNPKFRILLNDLCSYEYSQESLELQRSYYESIKDTFILLEPEHLIPLCMELIFFDMPDTMVEYVYHYWKGNQAWDLWAYFPLDCFRYIDQSLGKRQFYIIKHSFTDLKKILVIDPTNTSINKISDSIIELPYNSTEAKILVDSDKGSVVSLCLDGLSEWEIIDIQTTLGFLLKNLMPINKYMRSFSIDLKAIKQIKDPKERGDTIFNVFSMQLKTFSDSIEKNNSGTNTIVNQQDKESIINCLDIICRMNVLKQFINSHEKLIPALPKNYPDKYQIFSKLIEQKQEFSFDIINLYLLFLLENKNINLKKNISKIYIFTTTWINILNFSKDIDVSSDPKLNKKFLQWVKDNTTIINQSSNLQYISEIYINKQYWFTMIDTVNTPNILGYIPFNPDVNVSIDKYMYNIVYLLEYSYSSNIIDHIKMKQACVTLSDKFPPYTKEIYKIFIRYIWNDLVNDINNFSNWNLLKDIQDLESILDELEIERPKDKLKLFILKYIKK
ncbi:MAG: hypothetical protein ACRC0X_02220 [Brevinema sp.]